MVRMPGSADHSEVSTVAASSRPHQISVFRVGSTRRLEEQKKGTSFTQMMRKAFEHQGSSIFFPSF